MKKILMLGIVSFFIVLPIVNSIGLTYDPKMVLRGNLTDDFNGTVTIKNPNNFPVQVNISMSGDIENYTLSEDYVMMTTGGVKKISFELIPNDEGIFDNSVGFLVNKLHEDGNFSFPIILSTSIRCYVGEETTTTIHEPEPTPTTTQPQQQSSGGSSGGGFSYSSPKNQTENVTENITKETSNITSISLTIRPVKMILRGNVTESMDGWFNLTNPNDFPIRVNITPTFNETIAYEIQPYVDLDVGESKQVNFTLIHSCTGTYHNSILVRATAEEADMYMESLAYVEIDVQTIITSPEVYMTPERDYTLLYIIIIIIIIAVVFISLKIERRSNDVRENKE